MLAATAEFLISDIGRRLLDEVAALPGDAPARVLALRKRGVDEAVAAGAVDVALARQRAGRRFPDAARLYGTPDAFAQATSPLIADYHAERLAPFGTVADLGCGIGMDAVALARRGARVLAIERDPARLVFARANAGTLGVADRIEFREGDVTALDWMADAAYWDPARRTGERRVSRHAERYEPPLSFLDSVRERVRGGAVKLSPALPDEVLASLGGSVEFLSERGECKEAAVWFGDAALVDAAPVAAVLLPERNVVPTEGEPPPVAATLGAYIHDPDAALIRAGVLGTVANRLGMALVDASDSYLTSDTPAERRLASSYRVLAALPYRPKALKSLLKERGIGRLVVKKRHFEKEPDAVVRELGITGKGLEATLIVVRTGRSFLAVLCEPPTPTSDI